MTAWLFASGIGVLTATGVWLLLRARTFDVALGLTLLSYAVNLFVFAMGRIAVASPPIIRPGVPASLAHYADPLPQALALTAAVQRPAGISPASLMAATRSFACSAEMPIFSSC